MTFALILLTCNYVVGVTLGGAMGYLGRGFDLVFQRLIEIWSNVPFLYVIMIIASVIVPNFWTLVAAMVYFRLDGDDLVHAHVDLPREGARVRHGRPRARRVDATHPVPAHFAELGIYHRHVHSVLDCERITALTALDYLGFGLPPPTPSWGELLAQGTANLNIPGS